MLTRKEETGLILQTLRCGGCGGGNPPALGRMTGSAAPTSGMGRKVEQRSG